MLISLQLFASPRELLGQSLLQVEFAGGSLSAFRAHLQALYPQLQALLPSCSFAVEDSLIAREAEPSVGCPVRGLALIPPVSGG